MTFDFSKKLFVSTIAEDCAAAAREHSLGLEIAEFCYAPNMDTDSAAHFRRVSQLTAESGCGLRLLLHAPEQNELFFTRDSYLLFTIKSISLTNPLSFGVIF